MSHCGCQKTARERRAMPWQRFCNARRATAMQKKSSCILCAAHLNKRCEAGDLFAGFAALLGRFLPRLGPHGLPRGPFYFPKPALDFVWPRGRGPGPERSGAPDAGSMRTAHASKWGISCLVLRCNITTSAGGAIGAMITPLLPAVRVATAALQRLWPPCPSARAPACGSPGSWRALPHRGRGRG